MNFQPNWKRWRFALAVVTLLTLPLLAYVQYSWIGDLSDRELDHMHTRLRTITIQFAWDLNRHLSGITEALPLSSTSTQSDVARLMARQAAGPRAAEPWSLIDTMLFIRVENGEPVIQAYDPATHDLIRTTPPAWLDSVVEIDRLRGPQEHMPFGGFGRSNLFTDPATIVIGQAPDRSSSRASASFGLLVVKLNRKNLRDLLVAPLARSHFQRHDIDCDIVIAGYGNPPRIFYSDISGIEDQEPDVVASLAMPPMISQPRSPGDSTRERNGHKWSGGTHHHDDYHHPMRMPQGGRIGTNPLMATIEGSPTSNTPPRMPPGFNNWELRVFARKGSVEGMVGAFRARNLAVSFGILLILGIGVTVTLVVGMRAERLARERLLFVAGVSHEFRTPLAVIRAAGENLADGVVERPERAREYGRLIRSEADRLWALVEQALAYGGIRSGESRHRTSQVAIGHMVAEALEANHAEIVGNGIEVTTEIADDLPTIEGDPVALATAVSNLIANAIKYRGGSTSVAVRARLVSGLRGSEIAISVADHGIGIPRKELRTIFEPFFRGASAVDAQIGGSGLGLSIVRHIATRHGGRIEVESRQGEGSTFTLTLPATRQLLSES